MSLDSLLLPCLTFLAAMITIISDPKKTEKKAIFISLILIFSISTILTISSNISNYNETKNAKAAEKKAQEELRAKVDTTNSLLSVLYEKLLGQGWNSDQLTTAKYERLLQSARANREYQNVINKLDDATLVRRKSIRLEYFPKDIDGKIVSNNIEKLGFSTIIRPAKIPDLPSNAIWFGNEVEIEDVKQLAYVLIQAGVEIKSVRLFRNPEGVKSKLIQIGADRTQIKDSPLTVEQIKNAKTFPRQS